MTLKRNFTANCLPNHGKYALISTQWNTNIVDHLVLGAQNALISHGVENENIISVKCPGAFEIPLVAKRLAIAKCYDAIVALGAIIRGTTSHFEYVANEAVRGLSTVMIDYNIPVAFGILTVDNLEQAIERAGNKMGNKGAEAAIVAFSMVNLCNQLDLYHAEKI